MHIADGLGIPSFVLLPYAPNEMAVWHSRHPLSVNLLATPSDPLDVNYLDWNRMDKEMMHFFNNIPELNTNMERNA